MTHPEASDTTRTATTAQVNHIAALVAHPEQEFKLQQSFLVCIQSLPIHLEAFPAKAVKKMKEKKLTQEYTGLQVCMS